jgi:heme/copper-type cytochrome/quinol oxidase subunit 2
MDPNNVSLLAAAAALLAGATVSLLVYMPGVAFIAGYVGLVLVYYVWYDERRAHRNRDE